MNGGDDMEERWTRAAFLIGLAAVALLVSGCIHAAIGNMH